ncbi:MAG: response regulator [Candidatus Omnitrophica bacterium]|nr:response regulator [Candidatus Omnitrophota bacterium]
MGKKRILIVDDEVGLTRLLKLNLEQTGAYEVRTENQGSRALAAAREFRPDLILCDVIMPDMEGSEVAAQLQADPSLAATPIVFLTAVVSREEVEAQGGLIGGRPFLAKPAPVEKIVACIEQHLHTR